MSCALLPNLGAEELGAEVLGPEEPGAEGPGAPPVELPAVAAAVHCWRLLFPSDARVLGGGEAALAWPEALGAPSREPAFEWLDAPGRAFAWLVTAEAEAVARREGLAIEGAPAEVVRRVHDKAFAHAVADREGLIPRALRGSVAVFDPEELAEPEAALRRLEAHVRALPEWTGGRFALKPRLGTSGRGRVPGRADALDAQQLRGAFARLAHRGGALCEPWLDRTEDLSVQLHLPADGPALLLGTLRQVVSASGVYLGSRGWVDYRGRVSSGSDHDESLREAGALVGAAARAEGFTGPCGVDSFAFRGEEGRETLRPVVELNARFTMGTVVAGLIRRALPRIRDEVSLSPGERRPFHFALEAPSGGWPGPEPGLLVVPLLPLPTGEGGASPALLVADTAERLADAVPEGAVR